MKNLIKKTVFLAATLFMGLQIQAQVPMIKKIKTPINNTRVSGIVRANVLSQFSIQKINGVNKTIVRKSASTGSGNYTDNVIKTDQTNNSKDPNMICKTDYHNLDVTNLNQDVINSNDIASLRLGGIYDLNEFKKGNYKFITEARNPVNIGITGIKSVSILDPTDMVGLANGETELLNKPFPVFPSLDGQLFDCKIVNSKTELQIAAGLSYSGFGINASDKFQYNENSSTNKVLLTYICPTFTESILDNSGTYFKDTNLNSNQDLVVMHDITYGAKLLVYFESNLSEDDTKNAFSASGHGLAANLSTEKKNMLNSITYKIFLYGSTGSIQIANGYDDLFAKVGTMVGEITNKNKRLPLEFGKPISYSLRFLNGDIAATNCNANNLPSQTCTPNLNIPMTLTASIQNLVQKGGNNYGWIDFELVDGNGNRIENDIKIMWDKTRGNATNEVEGSEVGADGNTVSDVQFNNISANDRANGSLRVWHRLANRAKGSDTIFLVKPDSQNVDEGKDGQHSGSYSGGQFYDIKLADVLNSKPGEKYKKTLVRKGGSGSDTKEMDITVTAIFR